MAELEREACLSLGHAIVTPEPKLTKTDRRAAVRFGRGHRKWKLATTTLNKSKND